MEAADNHFSNPQEGSRSGGAPGTALTVIVPGRRNLLPAMAEVWRFRELLFFMIWRDVSVRYKQTVLGFLWVVLQPLVAMIIFTAVFNRASAR